MRIALAPPPGLNSDETTFARPGTWEDGSNVRFRDGKLGGACGASVPRRPFRGICFSDHRQFSLGFVRRKGVSYRPASAFVSTR